MRRSYLKKQKRKKEQSEQAIESAELQAKEIIELAREKTDVEFRIQRNQIKKIERKLSSRQEEINRQKKQIEKQKREINQRSKALDKRDNELNEVISQQIEKLEEIASLNSEEAKQQLIKEVEKNARFDLSKHYRMIEDEVKHTAESKARMVLGDAIQRLAADVVSERTVDTIELPDGDMKGRIIGKEGRNIRAIEKIMGVDLIMDDSSPQSVTVSCFDPIRREVAKISLENLVRDGRIQPARVEEMVQRSHKKIEDIITKACLDAMLEVNIKHLPPEIIKLMGRLKYRYSYGENVLRHSIEVGLLAGMMAAEIGANVYTCKLGGFLHDIGKALTHDVEGPHAEIGADIVKNNKFAPEIVTVIREHHDSEMTTVESFIVAAADALSAARPGARRDTLEKYIARLTALENVALGFEGVDKCFAINAGREVRVMVDPNGVDDNTSGMIARDIAKKIKDTLNYPGQIKVVVIREKRSIQIA